MLCLKCFVILWHIGSIYNKHVFSINISNAKKMNCAMMFTISNHYVIKSLSILLQLEPCNVMFKMISDTWHIGEIQLLLQLNESMQCKENDWALMFI